jgi:NADH/NAD ratio-sensing transcriptional regulator Rex
MSNVIVKVKKAKVKRLNSYRRILNQRKKEKRKYVKKLSEMFKNSKN